MTVPPRDPDVDAPRTPRPPARPRRPGRRGAPPGSRAGRASPRRSALRSSRARALRPRRRPGPRRGALARRGDRVRSGARFGGPRASGVPITADSVFRIASTSKQFTAASVLLLVEDGKLGLDTPLVELFPEFANMAAFEPTVRLRHLVSHTSGLPDYLWTMQLAGKDDGTIYTLDEVLAQLARIERPLFPAGERFAYSNTNYLLLGEIVHRVSGRSLRRFAQERIFAPLGMEHTHFHDRREELVPNRALGYDEERDAWVLSTTPLELVGDGGVFTTVGDLFLWAQQFRGDGHGPQVFDAEARALQLRPFETTSGRNTDYAFGLDVERIEGGTLVRHGGAFVGYRAELVHCPEQGYGCAVLMNRADGRPDRLADDLLRAMGCEAVGVEEEGPRGGPPEHPELPEWVRLVRGVWVADDGAPPMRVARSARAVVVERGGETLRFHLAADGELRTEDGAWRLEAQPPRPDSQESSHVVLHGPGGAVVYRRAGPWTEEDWATFLGTYRCVELGCTWVVRREDDRFVIDTPGGGRLTGTIEGSGVVRGPAGGMLARDGSGRWILESPTVGRLTLVPTARD
ncbi:MAG: serine hydrolase domain-containing protein [Planctomycetota bacterium]